MMHWLAPATVCLMVALAAYRQENSIRLSPTHRDPRVATMLSNQNYIAYLAGGPSSIEHNVWSRTFEFTNSNGSALNGVFTPFIKPNQ